MAAGWAPERFPQQGGCWGPGLRTRRSHEALRPRGWCGRAPGTWGHCTPSPLTSGTGMVDRTAPRGVKGTGETRLGEAGGVE